MWPNHTKPYQRKQNESEREKEKSYTNYSRSRHQNKYTHSGKKLLSIKAQFFFIFVCNFCVVCYVRNFFFVVVADRNRSQSANNITALTLALNDGCCFFFFFSTSSWDRIRGIRAQNVNRNNGQCIGLIVG